MARVVNCGGRVSGEYRLCRADTHRKAALGDGGFVEVTQVIGVFHARQASEAVDIEVRVPGGDDLDRGAVALEQARELRGFGSGERLLEGKEDSIRAEGEGAAERGTNVHTGGNSLLRAGGDLGVLFGRAANHDRARTQLRVIAPGEGDEKVGDEEACDLHWISKIRTSVLRFPDFEQAEV
jgi:hypothetical protein